MTNEGRGTAIAGTAIFVMLFAAAAIAQTTGRIEGQVADTSGAALPGVEVMVSSASLQGTRSVTTDAAGNYRFLLLPSGTYSVKAALAGFKTVEQQNVQVGIDRSVVVNLQMPIASVVETVEVQAASPVVDTRSTELGINARSDLFNRLPMQRDMYAIARVAPGTLTDAVGPTVFGSSGAENQYIIEGLNTTGLEHGAKGKQLNVDFVDEFQVKTAGLNAEYGRMTGGVINVVTKSGGNDFHGSLAAFTEGGALKSENSTAGDRPQWVTTVSNVDRHWDGGVTFGGPIAKDKLWFFGAYNHTFNRDLTTVIRTLTAPGSPGVGAEIPADTTNELFAGKLTYKLSQAQTLTASVNGDPSTRKGNVFAISGPPSTWDGKQTTGGTDGIASYKGVFGSRLLIEGLYGRHAESSKFSGPGKDSSALLDQTVTPTAATGGFSGFFQDSDFHRNLYKADVTTFLLNQEIKGGIDWEDNLSQIDRFQAGAGMRISKLIVRSTGTIFYRHRFYVNDRAAGYDREDPTTWQPAVPLTAEPGTLNSSFYIQDNWRVTSNFSINGGVRWERQEVKNRDDDTVIDLTTNWAPRVGFVWDPARTGRSKVFAHYGRFFESIPLDINIRSFGGEVTCFCYNFVESAGNFIPDPSAPRTSTLLGGKEPVDPHLRGQYINEYLIGGEYEVARNLSVGVKYIHRDLGRVIEDFLIPSQGDYFIANPGQGLGNEMAFYSGGTVAAPKARRNNDSVEVSARKSFSDNWQFLASYVWSKLDGNYDGTFQNSTGQLDPNINSAFDYADFLVNAKGPLTNDRVHQLKFDGSYEFSQGPVNGLNLGLSTHWFSGLPLNAYGYSFAYANWEYYLVPRGSLGRGPADWETDIQASYPIKFGNSSRLQLLFNVYNLFDRQKPIQLDERYNLVPDGPCAGVPEDICNGDGGLLTQPESLTPVTQLSNPRSTATNPDYLRKGIVFSQPRSLQIGVKFLF